MIRTPSRFFVPDCRTGRHKFKLLKAGLFMLARNYSTDIIFPPIIFPLLRSSTLLSGEARAVLG